MIPLMVAALGGGIATGATVLRYGALAALVAAPFGGSAAALAAALMLARQRGPNWQSRTDLDEQSDAMVRALRSLAEQGPISEDQDRAAVRDHKAA